MGFHHPVNSGHADVAPLPGKQGRLDAIGRARQINGVDSHAQNIRARFLSRRCE